MKKIWMGEEKKITLTLTKTQAEWLAALIEDPQDPDYIHEADLDSINDQLNKGE